MKISTLKLHNLLASFESARHKADEWKNFGMYSLIFSPALLLLHNAEQ
jgi:hypothetical protein